MNNLINSLKNPENKYKPTPFWSWNDKLEIEDLKWQIKEMHKVGLGGYFMHARGGLRTEYMGEDWFDCVKTCITEGQRFGMDSWSYDEEGWPSGFGGGKVTALGDEYHVKWLEHGIVGKDELNERIPLAYYTINDETYEYFPEIPETNETVYFVCRNKNLFYIDILNPKVVQAFIESTYDEYYNRIGNDFGDGKMPGFFTDEPQYSNGRTPWSYTLPQEFEKRYGYNIFAHLICLFKEVKGAEAFRYDFWKMVNDLYTKSFGKQIFDWCNEHNCLWTGHVMNEDNLYAQMRCTAGVMPFYEHMHRPGIDWLCRGIASPIIPKQVSSVARQLGKEMVLTETFALCGWDVSFEELKWIAEWQFINGVTSICQHLESYSIEGRRKRDYPPSLFYQSPWWDDYKGFNEYFTKLGKLLAEGKESPDILVLHPIHSAWTIYTDFENDRIRHYDRDFVFIADNFAGLHLPYHFGDETIISSHGSISADKFIVGNCAYKSVVLPSMYTIDETTYELLDSFLKNGGDVVSIGDMPKCINGRPDSRMDTLSEKITHILKDDEMIIKHFSYKNLKNVSVLNDDGEVKEIRFCERMTEEGRVFFIQNQNRYNRYDVKINLKDVKGISLLCLDDLSINSVKTTKTADGCSVYLSFAPMQSFVLLETEGTPSQSVQTIQKHAGTLELSTAWTVESSDLNNLTIDYVCYSIDGGKTFSDPINILDLMDKLINMRYNDSIIIKHEFEICKDMNLDLCKNFAMVHEYSSEHFKIYVNDNEVKHDGVSWWLDKAFKKVDIRPHIKYGKNTILISGKFYQNQKVYDVLFGDNVMETERNRLTFDTELESIYLVGDFGVFSHSPFLDGTERRAIYTDGGFYISNSVTKLTHGEITSQGYPFFRGRMILSQDVIPSEFAGVFSMKKPFAVMSKLYVNDKFIKEFLWADYSLDISQHLDYGKPNKISLELITGNRNLLGPHHNSFGENYAVAPHSFSPNGNYSLHNWRDRYCFVKTGFND